ncbi:fimbrial protein [Escherichia coli]|nr:fimbrial protein [Escherichia coli]
MVKMKVFFIRVFVIAAMIMLWSNYSFGFSCQSASGSIGGTGTVRVPVNLQPLLGSNQNLVVDLSQSIRCKNDYPQWYKDPIRIGIGSIYQGALKNFNGSLSYFGSTYKFPLTSPTPWVNHTWDTYQGWRAVLYLTPVGAAGGVVIEAGSLFASLTLEKGDDTGNISQTIVWNLYANNSVIVPTVGCDVSARDVTVTLPDYPGSIAIPATIHCAQNQNISYYLSGSTVDSANSIFKNTASASPAQGIGIQMTHNGTIVPINNSISLGTVGPSPVSLGLTATYARTNGQVTAGNVQSIVGVTFIYQ